MGASSSLGTPSFWRFRADEVRALAENMHNADTRAAMFRIAEIYDEFAKRAEVLSLPQYGRRRRYDCQGGRDLSSSTPGAAAVSAPGRLDEIVVLDADTRCAHDRRMGAKEGAAQRLWTIVLRTGRMLRVPFVGRDLAVKMACDLLDQGVPVSHICPVAIEHEADIIRASEIPGLAAELKNVSTTRNLSIGSGTPYRLNFRGPSGVIGRDDFDASDDEDARAI